MDQQNPKPKEWKDMIFELKNLIQVNEQNLILLKAQLAAAQEQILKSK